MRTKLMKTSLIILGFLLISIGFGGYQTIQINELESNYSELELKYSYSMDMLKGFMYDKDGMGKQIEHIKNNVNNFI